METMISVRKIIENIKRFWWICLLTTCAAALFVGYTTLQTYRVNKSAENKDSYVGSATLHLSSENEKDNRAYASVLSSQDTKKRINEILEAQQEAPLSAATDSLKIQSMADSTAYGLTIISVGEKRTEIVGQAVIQVLLETATETMHVDAGVISGLSVSPCLWYPDGSMRSLQSADQRVVVLSASDFLSWRKLVIVCAGFFLGAALIFVAVLFDDKIRDEEEALTVLQKVPYLGMLELGKGKKNPIFKNTIREYFVQQHIQKGVLLYTGRYDSLERAQAKVETEIGNYVWKSMNMAQTDLDLACLKETDGIFIVMLLNYNTLKELKQLYNSIQVLNFKTKGLILVSL